MDHDCDRGRGRDRDRGHGPLYDPFSSHVVEDGRFMPGYGHHRLGLLFCLMCERQCRVQWGSAREGWEVVAQFRPQQYGELEL